MAIPEYDLSILLKYQLSVFFISEVVPGPNLSLRAVLDRAQTPITFGPTLF